MGISIQARRLSIESISIKGAKMDETLFNF